MKKKKQKAKKPATARDTQIDLVETTVQNPEWESSKDGVPGFPRWETREKNTKESAIETLYARNFLGATQKEAADRFRALWEAAGGKTKSLDYTSDRVDGGRGNPIIGRLEAAQEMERCRTLLGRRGYENVEAICGEGRALGEITPHKRERLTMADNLRADLDDLAVMWGLRTRRRRPV